MIHQCHQKCKNLCHSTIKVVQSDKCIASINHKKPHNKTVNELINEQEKEEERNEADNTGN